MDASRQGGRYVTADVVQALSDQTVLKDEMAIEAAIRALERHLVDPATRLNETIAQLAELENSPHALEFALATVNDEASQIVSTTILQQFPTAPEGFAASLASKLLKRFPLFFLFLPSDGLSDIPDTATIRSLRQDTETVHGVLDALSRLQLNDDSLDEDRADEDLDDAEIRFVVKRKGQSKKTLKKQAKRGRRVSPADYKTIESFGLDVPRNSAELCRQTTFLLESQMETLKEYLEWFRIPTVEQAIRRLYLPTPDVAGDAPQMTTDVVVDVSITSEEEPELKIALPPVLPMKAALYFDSADGFGEWRILISTRADRDLRQARRRDAKTFAIFVKKIKELSKGHFSDDNQKRLTGLDVEIPIYEAKMTGDTRLVYQVDCVPEFESTVERQVLRIFGIYTHAQLDRRFWDCMSRQLERRGAEYRKRCTFRNPPLNKGDNVYAPASWPPPAEPVSLEPVSGLSDMRKEDLEELHSLLVLEKFVTFSQALLNSILADQEVAHVFDVTPQEKKIIEHPYSCYVLGRSGTGKTTTMLFKMLGIERAWEAHREAMAKPRQLFVTQSRVLAEKVEEYFAKLLESLATASQSPTELVNIATRRKQQQEQGLVDRDEEIYWRGDLPKRYGALKEEHFPMFLTFDHICRLLESEFRYHALELERKEAAAQVLQDALELQDPDNRDGALSNDYMQQRRAKFVSYGTFLEEYWSHFPQSLTKGLDPTLVFGEFMGVIKGSELALERPEGYLDKDTYYGLSHRTQGTFANQREGIYKLFNAYLKRKKERGDYDAADRTHMLIRNLRSNGVPGQEMDFIYVDEAQDNLLIDALILRTLCRNPHGMFWAGDTAQTISVGSAFRFNDLKSFLYRYEEAKGGPQAEKRAQPESFHLAVNYRSHAGIVNCAHSVIQLITEFWPHAIDALGQETGMIDGLKPVFFSGWDQNTVRYEQFLFGESGSHIEFGAEQCILVRDDAARDRLRAQVGDIGLIMTLYESKGLEFNDVLLYNFFEDSTVDLSQWRVVLNALPQDSRANHPAPRFDDARHSGVCRELKFLYVAITRARKNLWIADGSEKGEPMRIVWTHKDQIQNCTPGTDVPRLAMSSTAEDWAKTALSLFNNRRYMQAMHCYERAGLPREKAVAYAYYLREVARSTAVTRGDTTAQAVAFAVAAEAFIASAQDAITEKRAYYRIAAECYVHAGDDPKAARAYVAATEYTLAAQHFRKAGLFEDAVSVVQSHKDKVLSTVASSIVDVSRLYFLREKQIKKARELFETDDEALEYMDDYGLDIARATFLEDIGRYADAAEVHFAEGNTLEAIRLLTLDRMNDTSMRRALQCVLDGLWSNLGYGIAITDELLKTNGTVAKLLRLADGLQDVGTDSNLMAEVTMFRAIANCNSEELRTLGVKFASSGNVPAAFLCLDRAFSASLKLQTAALRDIADSLQTFLIYARMLQRLYSVTDSCNDPIIRKVFSLQSSTEDSFLLHPSTFLVSQCNSRLTPSARMTDEGTLVPRWELEHLIKHVLKVRLIRRVSEENNACTNLRPLHPCLPFAVFNQCNRVECPRNHADYQHYDAAAYNIFVRVHILQILIYQTLYAVENSREFARQQCYWLRRLYEAFYPPYYKLGSIHVLSPELVPELHQGLPTVQAWLRDLLYKLDPYSPPASSSFLASLIWTTSLAFRFDAKAAPEYLTRVPCVAAYRQPALLRGNDKAYIVHDLLAHMQSSDHHALSRGILFLDHVLGQKLPIEITLLCDFMDHLCGSLVVAMCLQSMSTGGALHDLTLPKSWITRLLQDVEALRSKDFQLVFVYTKHMGDLLEQIYTGVDAGYLLFENRDLSRLGPQVRNIFFARICKNLCLLGYNWRTYGIKNTIHRAISSVHKPGRAYGSLIENYVTARSWDSLSRLIRHSAKGSALDEMIQLHHGSRPVPKTGLPNVRRVIYNRLEDIPWLLRTSGSSGSSGGLRPDAMPFVPTTVPQPESEDVAVEENTAEADLAEEDAVEQAVDMEGITQAIDAEQTNIGPAAPTPEEITAADTIASAYKRYVARTRSRKKNAAEETRRRIFSDFSTQSQTMEWPHRYYRMLFLGPIPHLYIAVEGMKNHLHEARSIARKRFNVVKHLELENVKSSLTQMNGLFKDALRLHQSLGPRADVHKARDLVKLKALALEAEAIMQQLPLSARLDWEKDMRIALRGIVEVKKAPAKQPKPELNTDDLGESIEH
ncbi:hypothetical protein K466DRAFT_598787 [Polyporus arcularius HHB13444]|uniref:UvrD-like helicase ATP-binding domain-containing protein n=1 Tax=Polyporus arcularius HHB13444 TaxID=1314778 RepID=A0A5C3PQC1_9APHY|nr:hypothetical protein K466DRAFT_598787 [Polyporus arcularius HHB13444]